MAKYIEYEKYYQKFQEEIRGCNELIKIMKKLKAIMKKLDGQTINEKMEMSIKKSLGDQFKCFFRKDYRNKVKRFSAINIINLNTEYEDINGELTHFSNDAFDIDFNEKKINYVEVLNEIERKISELKLEIIKLQKRSDDISSFIENYNEIRDLIEKLKSNPISECFYNDDYFYINDIRNIEYLDTL